MKKLADNLFDFIDTLDFKTKIMGVINANEDSFYEGSRFKGKEAIKKIEQMMLGGADIIDIGGVSSRPGSKSVDEEEEFLRIKPIVDEIYAAKLYEKIRFSLDSYSVRSLRYALERGFEIVNDITGLKNDEVAKIAAKFGASVVIMHMKGTPENMQKNPSYEDLIPEIEEFFSKRVQKAKSFGIKDKDIILDVGIGFGKSLKHNLLLIKHLGHFKKFGYELLVGASRKSMIDMIVKSPVEQRLPGTLSIHLKAVQNGASIIRCHDVKEHFQALRVQEAINQAFV